MKISYVFPGQGSQSVGMGRDITEISEAARGVFDTADRVLGFALSEVIWSGLADQLNDTQCAQPALLTAGVAYLRALEEKQQQWAAPILPQYVAGHSLGEYTALVAARSLGFEDALRLVWERGRLMKEAGEERPGGMAAVIGLPLEKLQEVVDEASKTGVIVIANANSPQQTVISGEVDPLLKAMDLAKAAGGRVTRLAVSIASHSPLMMDASVGLTRRIEATDIADPSVPLVGNVSGQVLESAAEIRQELSEQLYKPVAWVKSVETMVNGGTEAFVEVGPGGVLLGLIKRINGNARLLKVDDLLKDETGATISS